MSQLIGRYPKQVDGWLLSSWNYQIRRITQYQFSGETNSINATIYVFGLLVTWHTCKHWRHLPGYVQPSFGNSVQLDSQCQLHMSQRLTQQLEFSWKGILNFSPLKFSLQDTIDHHGPSIHSGHFTASINYCKKCYCNDHTITGFGITDKNSSTAYVILYELIDTWILDSNRRVGVWSLPWRWHILSIPVEEQAPKPVGWTMCFLLMTSRPVQKLCDDIHMYVHSLYE